MVIKLVGSVSEIYEGEKAQYVTVNGDFGSCKLKFAAEVDLSKLPVYPARLTLEAVCAGRNGKYGQELSVMSYKAAAA